MSTNPDETQADVLAALEASRNELRQPEEIVVRAGLDWYDDPAMRITLVYDDAQLEALGDEVPAIRQRAKAISRAVDPAYWPYVGFEAAQEWRQIQSEQESWA